jgi:two-component system sensor histidine kinase RegB
MSRRELERLGFRGELAVVADVSIEAWGSRAALRQILVNVLKNAVEATTCVPRPRIEVRVDREGEQAVVRVRDNGEGIRSEDLGRVGEPFQTTKEGGTGFGLYVCSVLAAQMDAALQIESREGVETCVTLTLAAGKGPLGELRRSARDVSWAGE